ncbi:hypothetical protein K458DRAFT_126039 [Lentithecium fluviatile CBS 122367]|uniref:Uncharacterized protein n=1 Tax=Lentithecium fluviatile CBS 122367 TaxID=1168545 RepID=A0A6G1JGE1_9PLEO|nr:hypothetical protein K458DRAFT_126039 [Lentithecium fluviatile CBS 122367]
MRLWARHTSGRVNVGPMALAEVYYAKRNSLPKRCYAIIGISFGATLLYARTLPYRAFVASLACLGNVVQHALVLIPGNHRKWRFLRRRVIVEPPEEIHILTQQRT